MPGITKSIWRSEILHDKNNDKILLIYMVKNWEIHIKMDNKGLDEDGGRNEF